MGLFRKKAKTNKQPIYEVVLEALDEYGRLPADFSLPEEPEEGGLRFASGAMDGIGIFHTVGQDAGDEAKAVAGLLRKACKRMDHAVWEELTAYLKEHHVVSLVDPLIEFVRSGESGIQPGELFSVGYALMTQAGDAESVKLGIAMTGLLDIENNSDCRKAILTLGKCDEFTLFSLVAVSGWQDGPARMFQLAQETHGWGKIHAVERLNADTQEIRDWIIACGCENGVLNSYLGLTCAEKGGLLSYLEREHLSPELFGGAGMILSAMLDEGPTTGISGYDDAERAVERYLYHANAADTLEAAEVVVELKAWLTDCEWATKDHLRGLCEEVLTKPFWPRMVTEAVASGDRAALWRGCGVAKGLGMDIGQLILRRMEAEPLEYAGLLLHLGGNPDYTRRAVALYQKVLPLDEIATGMGDEMGLGPDFKVHGCLDLALQILREYPGEGLDLIKAGLGSPVVRNRHIALSALDEWAKSKPLAAFDPSLPGLLEELRKQEVNDGVREKLDRLIPQSR